MKRWFCFLSLLWGACGASPVPPPETVHTVASPEPIIEHGPAAGSPHTTAVSEPIVRLPSHATTGKRRPATQAERHAIEPLVRACEIIRSLRFSRPVAIEIEDDVAIAQSLLEQVEDEEIEQARIVYGAIGLLDKDVDLRALFAEVLGEQVVGYYEPKSGRLVIRDDVIAGLVGSASTTSSDETKLVLIHELVHALQDQRLGLGRAYKQDRNADAENAFRAVVEGDATLAMLGDALRQQGIPLAMATAGIQQMGALVDMDALMHGEKLNDAPPILRVTLVAPYLRGLQLVAAIHARGGWSAVDRAHRSPPTTTEQVLHPEKFFAREGAEPIRMPKLPALKRAGFRLVEGDTLGELELGVYFGQQSPSGTDEQAAAGWAGDRLQVYQRDGEVAVLWWMIFDSIADAIEATQAAQVVSPQDARARVERNGRAVLVVRGLPPALHGEAQKAFATFARTVSAR